MLRQLQEFCLCNFCLSISFTCFVSYPLSIMNRHMVQTMYRTRRFVLMNRIVPWYYLCRYWTKNNWSIDTLYIKIRATIGSFMFLMSVCLFFENGQILWKSLFADCLFCRIKQCSLLGLTSWVFHYWNTQHSLVKCSTLFCVLVSKYIPFTGEKLRPFVLFWKQKKVITTGERLRPLCFDIKIHRTHWWKTPSSLFWY